LDSVYGGPRRCGQECSGARAEAWRIGARARRWLLGGAEEGEGDMAAMKARGGDELWRERGGKEGGVGCCEMRRGRGAFL
jgi:predicted component of type VI protein secretion system